jgi:hypothetical protein
MSGEIRRLTITGTLTYGIGVYTTDISNNSTGASAKVAATLLDSDVSDSNFACPGLFDKDFTALNASCTAGA